MAITREKILDYLSQQAGVDTSGIEDDTALFSSRLVDSFTLVDLIRLIETEGQFRIKAGEVNLENLDTIERILNFAQDRSPQSKSAE